MKNESKKYDSIVQTAKELFWKHGFKRISVGEICLKANVSKMTFYKFFQDKMELAKTIYTKVIEDGEKQFREILKENSTAAEKINKIILLKIEGTKDISTEFLHDFYMGTEPELKDFVENKTREAWNTLLNDFKKAQEAGIFRNDFKPEFIFKVQNKMVEMLEDESVLGMYESKQELILAFTNLLMYGIAPHN